MNTTTAEKTTTKKLPPEPYTRHLIALAILAIIAIPVPMFLDPTIEPIVIRVLIFAMMAVSWNIMSGFGGMFSFGHAAYFGIGAYTVAWMLVNHRISPWVGMAVGAVLAAVFAAVIGYLALRYRLKGSYFALATMAFAEMLRLLAQNSDFVNRAAGFHVPLETSDTWVFLQFAPSSPNYYWIALAMLVVFILVSILFLKSKLGRFTIAVRDDEEAAEALGISVVRTKVITMAISGALSAIVGGFFVQYYLFIDPELAFGSEQSITSILPAVIGGIGTVWGPLIGAAILGPLNELTASFLRNPPAFLDFLQGRAGLDIVLYGLLLVVIILVLPKGVYGSIHSRITNRKGRKK